ncbi:hypothetical protein FQR65_LT04602 [Abscondita terminalis]|nr:hypothetical protein FQR65_LT04602 [Abscondita terminalis]
MEQFSKKKRNPNPKKNANLCSRLTFFYALKIFWNGLKKEFTEDDIYETLEEHKSENLGDTIEKLWQNEILNSKKFKKRASLHKTMIKMFGLEFGLIGLSLGVLFLIIRPVQAISIANLTTELSNSTREPYVVNNSILLITSSILSVIIYHPSTLALTNIGLKMKISCSSLIYRKILRLNVNASQQTSVGYIINLLTNDVNTFDRYAINLHYFWIGPLQMLLYLYLMYQNVGLPSTSGIGVLLLFTPIYLILGRYISKNRSKASLRRDERLRLTNEIVNGINAVKMETLEEPLMRLVSDYRKSELDSIRIGSYLKGLLHLQSIFAAASLFVAIFVQALFNEKIDAYKLYLLANLYTNVAYTMATLFPQAIIAIRESIVSFDRIYKFLSIEECPNLVETNENKEEAIVLNNITVKWNETIVLENLNIMFPKRKLTAIVGSVGSGKTTLLHTILNESNIVQGDIVVNGSVSYSSQEAWIFPGTIKENILFGSIVDEERYKTVIKICALDKDFETMPFGDETLVGVNGTLLSGGQKVRINLARTIYRDADTYLLDDPLSAVDITVGKKIFTECFRQFLKEKTVILVSHCLHYLHDVDNVVSLCDGKILPNFQLKSNALLSCATKNENEGKNLDEALQKPYDGVAEIKTTTGLISWSTYKYYFSSFQNYFLLTITIVIFILSQASISGTSYIIKYWVNLEEDEINFSTKKLILVYFLLTIASIALTIFKILSFISISLRASQKLHSDLLTNIIYAKVTFFGNNSSGQILNRFSNDLNVTDELLPNAIFVIIQYFLTIVGSFVLMSTVNPWLLIPSVAVALLFYIFNSRYLLAVISLKRLEGITKSPVLEHLITLFRGLPTVRAFSSEDVVTKHFNERLDLHSCTSHLNITTSKAFGLWLDIVCVIYIVITILSLVIKNNEQYGGDVGLLLTQAIQLLGQFQVAVKQCAEVENYMTSVERIREYNFINTEDRKQHPHAPWIIKGKIDFAKLYLKYPTSKYYILKNLNCTIQPGEKIGIVGRTGSGKSSLVSTLFRLTETEGDIFIDGININNIDLRNLRSNLSIIPQNPFLFFGTIRNNLDAFNKYKDDQLWKVLDEVNLKQVFINLNLGKLSIIEIQSIYCLVRFRFSYIRRM